MTRTAIALAACMLTAASAHAQTTIATEAPPPKPIDRRIDTRIGMLLGGADVGDVTGASSGLHASLGYRHGDLTLMAEYGYLSVGDGAGELRDREGRMTRGAVVLRYMLTDVARPSSPVGGQFWVEGGGGVERVAWHQGGVLYRPEAALGFGVEVDGRGWSKPRPRHFGMYLGLRALLARAPETDAPSMCEGPCTFATPPSRNDVSLYLTLGLHFGR